jgi:hypothetical protein
VLDRTLSPSTGPSGAFTIPRIWSCSINGGKNPVKRKTQNVPEIFSKRPYLVVRMPSARELARKKRNRNERQRSRNLLMRNLLTAFDANRNHEMRRKIFLPRLQTFSTAGRQIFLDRRPTKTCCGKNFALCTLPCAAPAKLFHRNRIPFFRAARNCAARITPSDAPNHCNFAASFRCQLPLNFLHPNLYDWKTRANDVFFVPGHKCLRTGTLIACRSVGDALGIWRQTATPRSAEWRTRKRLSLPWCATASGRNTRVEKAGDYHHRGFARRKSNAKRFRKTASGIAGNSLRKHSGQRMGSTE